MYADILCIGTSMRRSTEASWLCVHTSNEGPPWVHGRKVQGVQEEIRQCGWCKAAFACIEACIQYFNGWLRCDHCTNVAQHYPHYMYLHTCMCVSTSFPCGLHVNTHSPCGPLTTNYIWLICDLLCHRRTRMSHCVRRAPSQRHPHPLHHPHLLPKEHHSLPQVAVQLLSVTTLLSLLCHQMQQGKTCGKQCRYSVFSQTLMLGHLQVATDRHAMAIRSQPHRFSWQLCRLNLRNAVYCTADAQRCTYVRYHVCLYWLLYLGMKTSSTSFIPP